MNPNIEQRQERVLLLQQEASQLEQLSRTLERQLPDSTVQSVRSLEEFNRQLEESEFDLVIVDYDVPAFNSIELLHYLQLRDHEPAVLVVSENGDPHWIAELYNSGCHKFLLKDRHWIEELGQAARSLLRMRKLEEQNHRLLGRLTEANKLLEEKNHRLDEFSATVAHDIRGPLSGIIMKVEYILEYYKTALDDRSRTLLQGALRSTERLTDLVQAMYEFARLGSKATHMGELDLEALVEEVVSDMHFDNSLNIKVGIDKLPRVWGSESLLRRVFINLVNNAVKYCDKDEVIINIGAERYVHSALAQYCEIFVEDNGPGIEKAELPTIFNMFQRGTRSGRRGEGLGVGLSVVQRIMELHYGDVRAESIVGQGTKFILKLPMEKIDFSARPQ